MKSQQGLTLIEILAATTILGVIMISFMSVTNFIGTSGQKIDRSIEALKIAEEQLNVSRSNITKNNSLPVANQTILDYSVVQQVYPLGLAPQASKAKNHVSLQSIVPYGSTPGPHVLIVTVGWE